MAKSKKGRPVWTELHPRFREAVNQRGIQAAMHQIPASRATVYRLLANEKARPSRAILRGAALFCTTTARPTP